MRRRRDASNGAGRIRHGVDDRPMLQRDAAGARSEVDPRILLVDHLDLVHVAGFQHVVAEVGPCYLRINMENAMEYGFE